MHERPGDDPGRSHIARHTPPSLPHEQLPPQRRQLAAHRAVVDPVAHPHHHPAQDSAIGAEMGPDLLADRPGQALDQFLLEPRVRLLEQRDPGMHPVELDVHQAVILLRDLRQQPLPAAPHHRLEEPHELGRRQVAQRALEQGRLDGLGDARRLERHADALVRLHGARQRFHEPAVALDLRGAMGFGREQQRLGVVARDGAALHLPFPPASRLARYSSTRRRLASESRFPSISLDAAAIERSTASRRSSRITFSFSPSISLRARASSCSYCSRALASNASRSFSATDLALATISCASARAPAMVRLCSSSSRTASARARSASSSCCWMRRSRSSTDLRIAGQPYFHNSPSRIRKTSSVQKISPVLMEKGFNPSSPPWAASWSATSGSAGIYSSLNSRANTSAASVAPSISAAVRIIAPRMSPEASGWRAIASTAWPPMRPMPSPAPITASPSPMPAPSSALAFLAAAAISAPVGCAP